MREIVLDTETTGLEPAEGHRIVEIGAVELLNHTPTGRTFHRYVNPERPMPADAYAVHGLDDTFLADKPRFKDVAPELLTFIASDSRLVIHNAAFDMKFLNFELSSAGFAVIEDSRALDTVALARRRFPGAPASLDALCRRFGIDNSARTKHGALLDSEILAEVYLELIGGRQPDFALVTDKAAAGEAGTESWKPVPRAIPLSPRLTEAERQAHEAFLDRLGERSLWRRRTVVDAG
jgi:DNA polymerase-3 subunit epsilon